MTLCSPCPSPTVVCTLCVSLFAFNVHAIASSHPASQNVLYLFLLLRYAHRQVNALESGIVEQYRLDISSERRRGRGARSNQSGRFEALQREVFDDGWESAADLEAFRTEVSEEFAKTIITRNQSPDISFDRSINPYRGCEHGCIYCYARPTHAFYGLSPGLDFETRLTAKPNAAERLRQELAARNYAPRTIALGTNTDPYQPIERHYRITREILQVLRETRHPVGIVTKSANVLKDLDILADLAKDDLVKVALSVTTLDAEIARKMEPRAPTPKKRLEALKQLSDAGVPTAVMVAPIVPAITDSEIESILTAARETGATEAGYVLLRMPLEIATLFREWLQTEFPDRADRVISRMQAMRGGRDYRAEWGLRQRGTGIYAEQIAARFRLACKRLGFNTTRKKLRSDLFSKPEATGNQLKLL